MQTDNRRYDIDWLRVIAIGLLLLYHTAIGFQAWGAMFGFIVNDTPWEALWNYMIFLNIWRIPLLFVVSGIGMYYASQNKNWKELLQERTRRILLPFIFGVVVIVPLQILLIQMHYHQPLSYQPTTPAHLWFLGNIFVYLIILLPLFGYLKNNEDGRIVRGFKKALNTPLGLLPIIAAFSLEVVLVKPGFYEMYAMTWHGFFLGLIGVFVGFCFALCGSSFWSMIAKWRWLFFAGAIALFAYRLWQMPARVPDIQMSVESNLWIFAIFAFSSIHLNKSSPTLHYLSQAAYPIYVVHMVFLYASSMLIFPLNMDIRFKFLLAFGGVSIGCWAFYEFVIRRINVLKPLFGLKKS